MSENTAPVFTIEKIFVKDLSVEVPNAPEVFLDRSSPEIKVQLGHSAKPVNDGYYEVILNVSVSAMLPENKTVFLVEVAQAGIFQIRNVDQADIEPLLAIGCPNILFPYARETISDATNRAGFQPILLAPVNFEALHQQRQQYQAQQSQQAQ